MELTKEVFLEEPGAQQAGFSFIEIMIVSLTLSKKS